MSYEERMKKRRMLRRSLNKLDLDHEYLKRKKDLTETEKRVLSKFLYIEKEVQTDPVVGNYFNFSDFHISSLERS